jgi:hypothetical protein
MTPALALAPKILCAVESRARGSALTPDGDARAARARSATRGALKVLYLVADKCDNFIISRGFHHPHEPCRMCG